MTEKVKFFHMGEVREGDLDALLVEIDQILEAVAAPALR